MKIESLVGEMPGIALTASRLLLAESMAQRVVDELPIHSQMVLFVTADVLDGVILRTIDADTPLRRVADGIVDHLSVGRVLLDVARNNASARPYIGVLAARGIAVGALNTVHLAATGEVTKGRKNQKITNIATAIFGVAAASNNMLATHITGVFASSIALATAPTHLKSLGHVTNPVYREL